MAKALSPKLRIIWLFWAIFWALAMMGWVRITAVEAVMAKDRRVFCSRFGVMVGF